MTDTLPKPKRRRWRWLVVGMLLLGGGWAGVWVFMPEPPEIKTAEKLKLGMYDFQVKKVMGADNGLEYSGQNGWGFPGSR